MPSIRYKRKKEQSLSKSVGNPIIGEKGNKYEGGDLAYCVEMLDYTESRQVIDSLIETYRCVFIV